MTSRGSAGTGSWRGPGNRGSSFPSTSGAGTSKLSESSSTPSSPSKSTCSRGSFGVSDRHSIPGPHPSPRSWRNRGPWKVKDGKDSGSEKERELTLEGGMERDEEKERKRRERFGASMDGPGNGRETMRRNAEREKELDWGFVSKGDTRLLDKRNQEKFYTEIVERYMRFCGEHSTTDGRHDKEGKTSGNGKGTTVRGNTSNITGPPGSLSELGTGGGQCVDNTSAEISAILLSMRKLREGILASRRMDQFVKEIYIFFVRAAIYLRSLESYLPAMARLLGVIHLHVPLSNSELSEFAGYYMLHFACRMEDYLTAFEVKKKYKVKDLRIDQAIMALIHNNYWGFRTARRKVDAYKGALMDCAEWRFRADTLKCLARAYHVLEVEYVEVVTGCLWEDVRKEYKVGWTPEGDGKKVTVRKKRIGVPIAQQQGMIVEK